MKVQVNTDNHIQGREGLIQKISTALESELGRFGDRITRIEAHLGDTNGPKGGSADIRCMLEARLAGLQPIAVTHEARELMEAVDGASEKLKRSLDRTLGKLNEH